MFFSRKTWRTLLKLRTSENAQLSLILLHVPSFVCCWRQQMTIPSSHPPNPCFNKAVSCLLAGDLFWGSTLLHFTPSVFKPLFKFDQPCGPFLAYLCPLSVGMTQTMHPIQEVWAQWLSDSVTVWALLFPIPFLVFSSVLLGFVSMTLLTRELMILRPA